MGDPEIISTDSKNDNSIAINDKNLPDPAESIAEQAETRAPGRPDYIQQLAWVLFDQTVLLHELDSVSRQVLGAAALLVDRSLVLNKNKPMKSVKKLVRSEFGDEHTDEVLELLAPLVALQADLIKRKEILNSDLSPMQQRAILTLAALLKIAASLDTSESQSTTIQRIDPARDIIRLTVAGPHAKDDGAAAESAAMLWEKIGYPMFSVTQQVEVQKIEPPSNLSELTMVLPTDLLSEAGRKVMRQQFLAMLSCEEGTRKGEDIEALHDMRVATRRMRAAFEVFSDGFDPKALKNLLKGLRATGRALGRVRDLDVFMEKAQRYMDSQPEGEPHGLDTLLKHWESQRDEARSDMLAFLDGKEYQAFIIGFSAFVNTPGAGALPLPKGNPLPNKVREVAPALIYERLAAVRAYDVVIGSAPVEQLHALRIEFKKLRYTVEYFRDTLGPQAKEVIDELKVLQDHLGDLNDAVIASQILQDFLKAPKKASGKSTQQQKPDTSAISAYLAYRLAERDQLFQSFAALWAHFNRPYFMKKLALAVSAL